MHCGNVFDAGFSPYQSSAPGNSPCFTGHDAPHLGQTLGLNAAGNLLGIVGVALVDRWYDLVLTRRLDNLDGYSNIAKPFESILRKKSID